MQRFCVFYYKFAKYSKFTFFYDSPNSVPVVRRGEGGHDHVAAADVDDVGDGLKDAEVEVRVSRDGAVEACLQERRPLFLQHSLRAAAVVLTHASHSRKHHLIGETLNTHHALKNTRNHSGELVLLSLMSLGFLFLSPLINLILKTISLYFDVSLTRSVGYK